MEQIEIKTGTKVKIVKFDGNIPDESSERSQCKLVHDDEDYEGMEGEVTFMRRGIVNVLLYKVGQIKPFHPEELEFIEYLLI